MSPQQLLLSWKDHNGALVSVFENLLKRNTLVDCTLAADGQYLKAHKVVLSACSSYFELLFSQESEKNPIVILKDVKFQELKAAVNFMYRGEVEVCEDRLAAFLEVADSLQIKGLGSDGTAQDYEKSPPVKTSKTAAPAKAHSRKEVPISHSENTGDNSITLDSDKNSNESSSHQQLPHRETSGSSPIPSTLGVASSFSIASASTSCPVRAETHCDRDKLEKNQCSSPSVSTFPSGDTVPSDVNTVIKTEPVTDTFLDEKSDETERDFDDVTMMEDQDDWDDPNVESMGDDRTASQHDPGFPVTHMKTEESSSEHMAGAPPIEHISSEGAGGGAWAALVPATVAEATLGACASPAAARHKKYSCALCHKVFSASNMPRHLRAHMGVRPYPCTDCDYAATDSSNLKRHRRMHTGERPYSCAVCGKTFAYSSALRIHAARH